MKKTLLGDDGVSVDDFILNIKNLNLLTFPYTDEQLEAFKDAVRNAAEGLEAVECKFSYVVDMGQEKLIADMTGQRVTNKLIVIATFEKVGMALMVSKPSDWALVSFKYV